MKTTNPQEADWLEEDEEIAFEVPGIDDCGHLYSLTSRDGNSSVYIRVEENPETGKYHAALTVDVSAEGDDCDNFCDDLPADEGPFGLPEHACAANLATARGWFRNNRLAFIYCDDSRRIARKYPYGLAPA